MVMIAHSNGGVSKKRNAEDPATIPLAVAETLRKRIQDRIRGPAGGRASSTRQRTARAHQMPIAAPAQPQALAAPTCGAIMYAMNAEARMTPSGARTTWRQTSRSRSASTASRATSGSVASTAGYGEESAE